MVKIPYVKSEVEIPENVEVTVEGKRVTVKGPKGTLSRTFNAPVNITLDGNIVRIETFFPRKKEKAMVGTVASHIKNMIIGATKGFVYKLKIVYAHFPINVKVEGRKVLIENFLGERAPRVAEIVGDDVTVRVEGDDVIVEGINIEHVGQTAANIQLATKIKDKDPRVFQDGIYVYEKHIGDIIKRVA
ncbi:MAG: 50S ribosomal protein L6 [Candidatus Odinarchaeota archaeon]|nr:50S ribosomal protein L6 [Candidatus Odinarchaeota archaeon]